MSVKYICNLDLGSSKIAGCLVLFKDRKNIKDIFFETYPIRCINKARITDISAFTSSLNQILDKLKKISSLKIRKVNLSIPCYGLISRHNVVLLPLTERGNRLITLSDIEKVKQEAYALNSCWEEEIIQSIPVSYTVDNKEGFLNPLGLYAHKLGVDLFTISVETAYFETLQHVFNKLGYEVREIFPSGLGILEYLLEKENLNKGVYLFLDIGAQITDIIAYEDKRILHIGGLLFGGDNFTEQISKEFNISFELAEEIKINYGTILEEEVLKDKDIMIKDQNHYRQISLLQLSHILNKQVEDFFVSLKNYFKENINKRINKIFVCGKSILLEGLIEKMELNLGIPVEMISYGDFGFLSNLSLSSILSVSQLLDYANCLQMVYKSDEFYQKKHLSSSTSLPSNPFKKVSLWLKEIYQEYF